MVRTSLLFISIDGFLGVQRSERHRGPLHIGFRFYGLAEIRAIHHRTQVSACQPI